MVLFAGTAILAFQDDFAEPVLGFDFWHGWFYKVYSLFLDVFGAALVVGLAYFAVKRGILRPFRLSYWRPVEPAEPLRDQPRRYRLGDWVFLGSLFFLALTGFLLESFRIAADNPSFEVWAPVGYAIGHAFRAIGFEDGAAADARAVDWWVHGVFALFWVSSIPFTKAVHMLAGPAGVAVKDDRAGNRLAAAPRRREGRGRRLRLHRRPLTQALARPRRLHEVRQVPRRVPGDRDRLPALTARPRPRSARGGRGLDGKPRRARHRPRVPRARADSRHDQVGDALVVHAVHGLRRDLPRRDRARPDHQPDAPRPRRAGRHGRPAAADARDDLHLRATPSARRSASAGAGRRTSTST